MEEIIRLIQANGIWVFLTGVITCIIIGLVKTPIRKKLLKGKEGEAIKKTENLFDTTVFVSTYVIAFLGAIIYYAITVKGFNIGKIFALSLPIYLSQSISYGIWKKLGLKRLLYYIAKLFVKDANKDGQITLSEAVSQVKDAFSNGKLDVDKLLGDAVNNATEALPGVVEDMVNETGVTPEMDNLVKAADGDVSGLKEDLSTAVKEVITTAKEQVKSNQEDPKIKEVSADLPSTKETEAQVKTIDKPKVINF